MASSYPGGYDTLGSPPANLSDVPHHDTLHLELKDAIEAMQHEMGINPSGADSTIAAVLASLSTRYAARSTGALTAWNPTVTQLGAVANTVTEGWSTRFGRLVNCSCLLAVTGAGTASNLITLSLPYAALGDGRNIGTGFMKDASANSYYPAIVMTTASGVNCYFDDASLVTAETSARLGSGNFTAGLANTDTIACNLTYQAAAD